MRLPTIILAFLSACSASGPVCKSDAGPSSQCSLDGTWASSKNTITFAADGTYTATLDGTSDSGTWSLTGLLGCGAIISFGSSTCGATQGMYGLSISPTCTTMSLSGQGDDCGTRAQRLADTQYKKQ